MAKKMSNMSRSKELLCWKPSPTCEKRHALLLLHRLIWVSYAHVTVLLCDNVILGSFVLDLLLLCIDDICGTLSRLVVAPTVVYKINADLKIVINEGINCVTATCSRWYAMDYCSIWATSLPVKQSVSQSSYCMFLRSTKNHPFGLSQYTCHLINFLKKFQTWIRLVETNGKKIQRAFRYSQ